MLAALGAGSCGGTGPEVEPLPVVQLETGQALEIASGTAQGLATSVRLTIQVAPLHPWPLTIVGQRPEGQVGDDALLDVQVKWVDYLGTEPLSYGKSFRTQLPFGADGEATPEQPFERTFEVAIDPPEARVLARKVEAWVRLYPVDVLTAESRSGGARLEFPRAYLHTWRAVPEQGLEQLLAASEPCPPADLFLAAVSAATGDERTEEVLVAIIAALPTLPAERREPLFGALQYLTDETQGRSVGRWQTWLEERQAARRSGR